MRLGRSSTVPRLFSELKARVAEMAQHPAKVYMTLRASTLNLSLTDGNKNRRRREWTANKHASRQ